MNNVYLCTGNDTFSESSSFGIFNLLGAKLRAEKIW